MHDEMFNVVMMLPVALTLASIVVAALYVFVMEIFQAGDPKYTDYPDGDDYDTETEA